MLSTRWLARIPKGVGEMKCYGKAYGKRTECNDCECAKWCRDAADVPLMTINPGRFNDGFIFKNWDQQGGGRRP